MMMTMMMMMISQSAPVGRTGKERRTQPRLTRWAQVGAVGLAVAVVVVLVERGLLSIAAVTRL